MNPKFYSLPPERRQAMFNAGCRVFAQNTYRKCPMAEIAAAAGVSKGLLFHYFTNKKELYLYLLETAARLTADQVERYGSYDKGDVFEMMHQGLRAKAALMRQYPDMTAFVLKAYYEKDPEVRPGIQAIIEKYGAYRTNAPRLRLDPAMFRPGLDLEMMYLDMFWAGEGYLWERIQTGQADVDAMERDFARMIDFWRSVYLRKEEV